MQVTFFEHSELDKCWVYFFALSETGGMFSHVDLCTLELLDSLSKKARIAFQ